MQMIKLSGVQNSTKVKLEKQINYVYEFVRQGKMVCDNSNQIWIDTHLFTKLEILTKGIETKASVTHEMKVSAIGNLVTVALEPPCEGTLQVNGEIKELTLEHPAALYVLKDVGAHRVLFVPKDPCISPVETFVASE